MEMESFLSFNYEADKPFRQETVGDIKKSDDSSSASSIGSSGMEWRLWPAISATTSFPYRLLDNVESFFKSKLPSLPAPVNQLQSVANSIASGLEKLNMDIDENIVTLEQVLEAHQFLKSSPDMVRTPTLLHVQSMFTKDVKGPKSSGLSSKVDATSLHKVDLFMKMENMQTTGSFKIRGVLNQMRKVKERHGKQCKLITMSAGNYGKAFAHCVGKSSPGSACVMPQTAPAHKAKLIENMGVEVHKVDTSKLMEEVNRLVKEEGFVFCHPFDDIDLIAGYASSALEVLEDVRNPDVILVCCGGGGLVSGVAAAVSLSKVSNCRVYAVEPQTAPTMYESFKTRRPVTIPHAKSVAAGLAPPYAGSLCYKHCRWFVEDVLLVSDEEMLSAMRVLFDRGIKAEPSGCAAFAALLSGKVPDVEGKKVVVYITGGNVSCSELSDIMQDGR